VLRLQDAGHGVTHQHKDVVNNALLEHFARAAG
jgi:pimeloyl-ACP methyl ester carboxylesterase